MCFFGRHIEIKAMASTQYYGSVDL
jgi:hypothetical protein